jgi:two-component system response regulator AtoC
MVDGNKFDIILMDIRMPKLDGLSALQMIRKNNSTPIVLITGYQVTESVERVLKDPTVACLKKPFTFDELRSVIARMALNGKGVPNA